MSEAKKPIRNGAISEGDTYNPGNQAGKRVEGGGQIPAGQPGGPILGGSDPAQMNKDDKDKKDTNQKR